MPIGNTDFLRAKAAEAKEPNSSTIKAAGMRGIKDRDKMRDRGECFIVGILTSYTRCLVVDESDPLDDIIFM